MQPLALKDVHEPFGQKTACDNLQTRTTGFTCEGHAEQRGTNSGRAPQQTAMATAFDNITPSLYTRQTDTLICAGD